jgi:phage-related protein
MKTYYHPTVDRFIENLPPYPKTKTLRSIILLETYGLQVGMPHLKKINPKLYELRTRGQPEIRILLTVKRNVAYLLHAFIKKSNKTPLQEIKTALHRLS